MKLLFYKLSESIQNNEPTVTDSNYELLSTIKNGIYNKIDFSNIPLNNVYLAEEDLSGYHGIKVDPQVIYDKSLVSTICWGVEFVGSFDDVCIVDTDFRGSRGAKIDPQKVRDQDFLMTRYNPGDVQFIGSFDDCNNVNSYWRLTRR